MDPTGLSNAAFAFGQCFEVGFDFRCLVGGRIEGTLLSSTECLSVLKRIIFDHVCMVSADRR